MVLGFNIACGPSGRVARNRQVRWGWAEGRSEWKGEGEEEGGWGKGVRLPSSMAVKKATADYFSH